MEQPLEEQPAVPEEPPQPQFEAPSLDQMQFVNLQDIQMMPAPPPALLDVKPTSLTPVKKPSLESISVVKPSSSSTPTVKPDPGRVQKSPRTSASQSPATPAGRLSSKSPAITNKPSPATTCSMMVALAEEFIDKARAASSSVAADLQPNQVDEYQKMIGTGLACLEGALQTQRLPPRQEALVRMRYAQVLQEETDNIMEAETTLSKGITLCEKASFDTFR